LECTRRKDNQREDLRGFQEAFIKLDDDFSYGTQHDAFELLAVILPAVREEFKTTGEIHLTPNKYRDPKFLSTWENWKNRNQDVAFLDDIFYSLCVTESNCNCSHLMYHFERTLSFILPIPSNQREGSYDIQDCLEEYFNPAQNTCCLHCNCCTSVQKKTLLQLPATLVIAFEKNEILDSGYSKPSITFAIDHLDLGPYLDDPSLCKYFSRFVLIQ